MEYLKKALHAAALAVTCLAVLLGMSLALPRLAGYQPYVVLSGSMEPAVGTGALAYISGRTQEIQEGDIIAYETEGGTVLHRIVGTDAETGAYLTKGDANETTDGTLVEPGMVLGKYARSVPAAGYVAWSLWHPAVPVFGFEVPVPVASLVCLVLGLNLLDGAVSVHPGKQKNFAFEEE